MDYLYEWIEWSLPDDDVTILAIEIQ